MEKLCQSVAKKKKKKELFSFPLGLLHFPFEPSNIHFDIYWLQAV